MPDAAPLPAADAARKPRSFSGIQPSGVLHIGNYLGAIRQWLAVQQAHENFFCVVDLHAITVPQDPVMLRRQTLDVAAVYLAAGIDPAYSTIFVQSHVSAHAELCWVLNTVTPVGWLERMTQYKSKSALQESVGAGLLDYPVLQAADILLYDADEVPVGEDQKQHVELCQDIAQRFNHLYGETFTAPQPRLPQAGARIRGFNDPQRKMSKSLAGVRGHAVRIVDEPDEIRWVLKRAQTDSGRAIVFSDDPEKAGVNNLLEIYELFTGRARAEIEAHFAGKGYGELKTETADAIIEGLRPLRERYHALTADPAELERLLAEGAERAGAIAEAKLRQVYDRLGFVPGRRGSRL
ncbi:MAG: tryptophan--tRNA ligase [Chloroflexota bacterium]